MSSTHHPEETRLYPVHLSWNTRWAIPYFEDHELGLACLEAIERERKRIALPVFAYALMPDHIHLIIGPAPMRLGYVVQALKVAVVANLNTERLVPGGLWKRGYWERALTDERAVRAAIDYVHANPVRKGLVDEDHEYKLCSAGDWDGHFIGPILLARDPELLSSTCLSF
jgi:putative transposase